VCHPYVKGICPLCDEKIKLIFEEGKIMAGKKCPKCGKSTCFTKGNVTQCSSCGYTVKEPTNNGKGGKGKRCVRCGKYTVFENSCNNCGAKSQLFEQ
jgi:rRNA maturation protein Nop10